MLNTSPVARPFPTMAAERAQWARLERDHGANLDALPAKGRRRIECLVFRSAAAAELGRRFAPHAYRISLLAALDEVSPGSRKKR
ncbi:hypothetical protein KOR34_37340 [Posidoniimonas corsicana]|uniref:Uncharacterized protein n=1 Tax=Posidoniimonas corsicana TaxID=1938618 RepID=A0A5C5V5T5_9BACT|nr:hypothetical protein [Posidoniimonas corsicana]TWT33898.1 hypothetical protein KOR34_37340 [Posidoniimonas corsicana]